VIEAVIEVESAVVTGVPAATGGPKVPLKSISIS
jgi:hypothetical protein